MEKVPGGDDGDDVEIRKEQGDADPLPDSIRFRGRGHRGHVSRLAACLQRHAAVAVRLLQRPDPGRGPGAARSRPGSAKHSLVYLCRPGPRGHRERPGTDHRVEPGPNPPPPAPITPRVTCLITAPAS